MFVAYDIVMTLQPLHVEIDTNARIYTLLIICECCYFSDDFSLKIFLYYYLSSTL